jgi:hypothetical protein
VALTVAVRRSGVVRPASLAYSLPDPPCPRVAPEAEQRAVVKTLPQVHLFRSAVIAGILLIPQLPQLGMFRLHAVSYHAHDHGPHPPACAMRIEMTVLALGFSAEG